MRPDMVAVSPPERVRYRWAKARRGVKTGRGKKGQMARGFWTGLLHGGVVGIAALAALSLATPLPQPERAAMAPAPIRVAPQPAEPRSVQPRPADPPAAEAPSSEPRTGGAPQTGKVDLPVGSEFGRGGDAVLSGLCAGCHPWVGRDVEVLRRWRGGIWRFGGVDREGPEQLGR